MVYEKVVELLCDLFDETPDNISPDTSFEQDLFADSLDIAELQIMLEEEFDLDCLDDESAEDYPTVADVVGFVEGKITVS